MAGKLTGKAAVVTGASKGIGAAIAVELAKEGAAVAVNYARDKAGADAVVKKIVSAGGKAIAVQANVADRAEVARLFETTKSTFGRVDILINNAGIYEFAPLESISTDHFHKQFDTNVLGLINATQEAARHIGPEGGSIVNIGSVVTNVNPPASAVYTATKASVDAVTHVFAKELGARKIRVNSIKPGMVETEGLHSAGMSAGEFRKQIEAQTPLGRIGQPGDIAPAAVYFASDDSSWVTGETLVIAGGLG